MTVLRNALRRHFVTGPLVIDFVGLGSRRLRRLSGVSETGFHPPISQSSRPVKLAEQRR
jgi:hypothetical protein